MSIFRPNTGNDAEDAMSEAAGCISIAILGVVLCAAGVVVLLIRWLA